MGRFQIRLRIAHHQYHPPRHRAKATINPRRDEEVSWSASANIEARPRTKKNTPCQAVAHRSQAWTGSCRPPKEGSTWRTVAGCFVIPHLPDMRPSLFPRVKACFKPSKGDHVAHFVHVVLALPLVLRNDDVGFEGSCHRRRDRLAPRQFRRWPPPPNGGCCTSRQGR